VHLLGVSLYFGLVLRVFSAFGYPTQARIMVLFQQWSSKFMFVALSPCCLPLPMCGWALVSAKAILSIFSYTYRITDE